MKQRRLKISYIPIHSRWQRLTKFFPKLILQGAWLREAEFNIGDQVNVIVSKDFIQIVKVIEE